MAPKKHSGRRKSGGKVKMSPEDQSKIERAEHSIEHLNRSIPSFIRDDMTSEEMQEAIISEIRRTGEPVIGIRPFEVDNRFPAPKDSSFAPLIRRLNRASGRVVAAYAGDGDNRKFDEWTERIIKDYSTKDLKRFVTDEIGEKLLWGGRKGCIRAIQGALYQRFNPSGSRGLNLRETLTALPPRAIDRIKYLETLVSNRKDNRRYIAEIQAKYKGGKK